MSQARKHQGYRSQKVVTQYLVTSGFTYAESAGVGRQGSDITGTRAKSSPSLNLPINIDRKAVSNPSSIIRSSTR